MKQNEANVSKSKQNEANQANALNAQNKPNFIFYLEYYEQLKFLDFKQKGQLLDALFLYQLGEEIPEMDPITNMAFSFISADIRRNNERYAEISEKRRQAGRKGGLLSRAKANQANQANASNSDSDSVSVSDSDSDSVCVSDSEREPDTHTTHTRPSESEVLDEAAKLNHPLSMLEVGKFLELNDGYGWKLDWRVALRKWIDHADSPPAAQSKNKFINFDQRPSGDLDDLQKQLARQNRNRKQA